MKFYHSVFGNLFKDVPNLGFRKSEDVPNRLLLLLVEIEKLNQLQDGLSRDDRSRAIETLWSRPARRPR